ncbi:MAG: DUF1365 domain-containing protein [Rhizobacter sp.]|nr:DUF1365 domain-containing protein [Bacteriovorax sp.]
MVNNQYIVEALMYHERLKPFKHRFFYKVFYFKFPIDQLIDLKSPLFSLGKFNLFSFHTKDYLDGSDRPLREKITEVLAAEGFHVNGNIILQTAPRMFGYGFNPVSFWYIYGAEEKLEAVLAEVNNTFGDHHYYLMQGFSEYKKITTSKIFHVSPFFDIKGQYEFSFFSKNVVINYFDKENQNYFFKSSLKQTKTHEFNTLNLLKIFLKFPLMTFLVTARIHWQALKLYLKKATFFTRPEPPEKILSKEVQQ